MTCYRFEERIYNDGIFSNDVKKNSIDATYIIHLEGNGRLSKINHELDMIHPTNHVFILHNKGYKNSKKTEFIKSPSQDLIDCYIHIFKHAKEYQYENILILEDDFFWNLDITNREHLDSITQFLLSNVENDFMYLLGCLPILQIPTSISRKHSLGISLGTHAVIYSRKCRERVLKIDQKKITDWDVFHNLNTRRYMYHKPLCYQLFPLTENQHKWLSNIIPIFLQTIIISYITIPILQSLSLDKNIHPGYPIFYNISFYLSLIFLVLIFWTIYYYSNKRIKRM